MIEPKLLHDYLQTDEAYSKQFDDMVKEDTDWWEQQFNIDPLYTTEEDLQKTKDLIKKSNKKKEYTKEDVMTEHHRFMQFGGVITSMSVQKTWDEKRTKTISKWKKEAKEKNRRILSAIPFEDIKCKKCNILLEYGWSNFREEAAKNISKVLFFYFCPNKCGNNQLIFEDGVYLKAQGQI